MSSAVAFLDLPYGNTAAAWGAASLPVLSIHCTHLAADVAGAGRKSENKHNLRGADRNGTRAFADRRGRRQVPETCQKGEKPKALPEKAGISANGIKPWVRREAPEAEWMHPDRKRCIPEPGGCTR